MGKRVVKQPDGMYAMWESTIDNFTHVNLTETEVEAIFTEAAMMQANADAREAIDVAEGRGYRVTLTWESALDSMRLYHGEKAVAKLVKDMNE